MLRNTLSRYPCSRHLGSAGAISALGFEEFEFGVEPGFADLFQFVGAADVGLESNFGFLLEKFHQLEIPLPGVEGRLPLLFAEFGVNREGQVGLQHAARAAAITLVAVAAWSSANRW